MVTRPSTSEPRLFVYGYPTIPNEGGDWRTHGPWRDLKDRFPDAKVFMDPVTCNATVTFSTESDLRDALRRRQRWEYSDRDQYYDVRATEKLRALGVLTVHGTIPRNAIKELKDKLHVPDLPWAHICFKDEEILVYFNEGAGAKYAEARKIKSVDVAGNSYGVSRSSEFEMDELVESRSDTRNGHGYLSARDGTASEYRRSGGFESDRLLVTRGDSRRRRDSPYRDRMGQSYSSEHGGLRGDSRKRRGSPVYGNRPAPYSTGGAEKRRSNDSAYSPHNRHDDRDGAHRRTRSSYRTSRRDCADAANGAEGASLRLERTLSKSGHTGHATTSGPFSASDPPPNVPDVAPLGSTASPRSRVPMMPLPHPDATGGLGKDEDFESYKSLAGTQLRELRAHIDTLRTEREEAEAAKCRLERKLKLYQDLYGEELLEKQFYRNHVTEVREALAGLLDRLSLPVPGKERDVMHNNGQEQQQCEAHQQQDGAEPAAGTQERDEAAMAV